MTNKHIKRCSASQVIRLVQIKITAKYNHTPIEREKITKPDHTKMPGVAAQVEGLDLSYTAGRNNFL